MMGINGNVLHANGSFTRARDDVMAGSFIGSCPLNDWD